MSWENCLFWGLVIAFTVGGIRMRFIASFCMAISTMFALYLGFWQITHYSTWGNLIPKEYTEYVNPCLFVLLFFISLVFLRFILNRANSLYEKQAEEENGDCGIFSKLFLRIGTAICNALTGITIATLIFLLFAVLPLTAIIPGISAKKMASEGACGMSFISAVVDLVTMQPWRLKKKAEYMRFYLNSEEDEAEETLEKMASKKNGKSR